MEPAGPPFLDVQTLIEASHPRPRIAWLRFGMAGFVVAVGLSWIFGRQSSSEQSQQVWSSLIAVGMLLLVGGMAAVSMLGVRQVRGEQGQLHAMEELIQLRRWPEAAMMLQVFLSRPARSAAGRAQALLYLAMVLARYHRFEESVAVHDYLLRTIPLDEATGHAVRLGRAMALLREENLLDADRAISELRRESRGIESAGLALVEIYRDVKTGHPAEAIEMFDSRRAVMSRHLGHRVADAWGLAARAYDLLDRPAEARAAYENATRLAPLAELVRRYPEIAALGGKFFAGAGAGGGGLTMIPVDVAIWRFRRDLTVAAVLRTVLLATAAGCMLVGPLLGFRGDGMFVLMVVGGIWMVLSYRSMYGTRLAADSSSLIAAGEFEQAENRIDSALRSFSLFRTAKLLSLHHLALLRHAQRRWRESSLLCQALLGQKLGNFQGLSRTTRLLMADSMLQIGDLRGAFEAMTSLQRYRLGLGEALTLQLLQLEYGSRIGAWEPMLESVGVKVQMSELMPSLNAARSQALLALAAYKKGRVQLAQWLRRRAELLAETRDIAADRPVLAEMFNQNW